MKLNQESVEVISNVKTQQTAYSFSDNAQDASMAIDIITNKGYKYKCQTPVQEYLCNARDAHRENGQKRKIEVTAPTVFDPVFKVRDFGSGLSPEMMVTVFVKFFASTKRRDNKMTGGFGLGAKSAWAYSDSFGIVSIENGMKRSYTAYKAGQGMLQPDLEEATKEPSGLEISIPVKPEDIKAFALAIKRAVYFWSEEERPVLKNMEMNYPATPKTFGPFAFYDMKAYNETFKLDNYRYDRTDRVILDGVIYDLQQDEIEILNLKQLKDHSRKVMPFFVVCKTGELSPTPFRENLEFNAHTIEALKKAITSGFKVTQSAFQTALDKAKSVSDKVETIEDFSGVMIVDEIKLNDIATYRQGQINFVFTEEQYSQFSAFRFDRNGQKLNRVNTAKKAGRRSYYGGYKISVDLKMDFFSFETDKDDMTDLLARKKVIQQATKTNKTVMLFTFDKNSGDTKDLILSVIPAISTDTLTFEKLAVATKTRTVRTAIEVTDFLGKMTSLEKDGKVMDNLMYMFASDTKGHYGMRNFATLMKKYDFTVVSISKADEKFVIARGGKTFDQVMSEVKFEEKDLTMLLKENEDDHYGQYMACLDGMFKNKTIAKYLDMPVKMAKYAKKESGNFRHLEFLHNALKNDTVYAEMLTAQKEGVNMIKKDFPIIMNLDSHMIQNMKQELEVYIQGKEKQLGAKSNG